MSGEGQQQQQQQQQPDMNAVIGGLSEANRTVAERKGWTKDGKVVDGFKLDSVFDSYSNLEKLQGKKTLEEPNLADPEAFKTWPGHKLLGGVPEKIEGYDLGERPQLPEGLKWSEREGDGGVPWDDAGEKMLRTAMLKGNLYPWQAKAMMKEIVQERVGLIVQARQAAMAEAALVKQNMQAAFGAGLDGALESGKQALAFIGKKAGLDEAAVTRATDQLASLMGNEAALRLSIQLGRMLGEDALAGGKGAGFATGPEAAKAQIEAFKADPEKSAALMDKSHPKNRLATEEWQRLNALANPKS